MPTYKTGDAIGTASPKNLYDDAQDLDFLMLGSESSYPDRLSRQRKSWAGFESEAESLITNITAEFEKSLASLGYTVKGDYSEGIITLNSKNELIQYNGEFYRLNSSSSVPFTTTGTTAATWDNDSRYFVAVGDADLRSELSAASGTFIALRAYTGDFYKFDCLGCSAIFDGGEGTFIRDDSDSSTVDNSCTVIIDAAGRRWKRQFEGNIQAKWAGIKYVDETTDFQDDAFANLLLASAVDSPTGYPNKIIEDLSGRRIKLANHYYIRGGSFNNNDTIANTSTSRASRFGIDATFVLDGSAGFTFVQMVNPKLFISVDNSGVTLAITPTIDNYAIRCECLVITPEIKWKITQYTGTAYYQLGKYRTTDEFSSIWSDLTLSGTANYGGMTNLDGGTINIGTVGRAFYWKAGGAGFGHLDSIWKQNCTNPSYYYDLQDFTFQTFETYIATVSSDSVTKDGDVFEQCGGHFDKLLTGQGGYPNVAFINNSTADIGHLFIVCGSAQGTKDGVSQTGCEVHNSSLHIGTAHVYHPNGRGFVIGGASGVHIGHLFATFPWQCVALGNEYITSVSGVSSTSCDPRCIVKSFAVIRGNNSAYVTSSRPQFEIGATVREFGQLAIMNGKFENVNNGFSDPADLYVVKCLSTGTGVLKIENVKFGTIVYPVYCVSPDNLVGFRDNDFDSSKLYYAGVETTYGGRDSAASSFVTYFNGVNTTTSFQYWGKTPLRISFRITITTASATSVLINSVEVKYMNEAGHYSFEGILQYGDQISMTGTAANLTTSGATIRHVRNVF